MQTPVKNITPKKYIAVLDGAVEALVCQRELRNKYQTNRSIKTWAAFFLLKAQTTSGCIQQYKKQYSTLADVLHCSIRTLKARINELTNLKLLTTIGSSLQLTSFEKAADILDIPYNGTIKIEYNEKLEGNQIFQYFLRAAEISNNQQLQVDALNYYADKNPLLKNVLIEIMINHGADMHKLSDYNYFQQQLLKLQLHYFKTGSTIWNFLTQLRADVNRSCNGIKRHHKYKAAQSVSYLKQRMHKLQLINIQKTTVESDVRTRLYVANNEGKRLEIARYCPKTKRTFWRLCDAITAKYYVQTTSKKQAKNEKRKAA